MGSTGKITEYLNSTNPFYREYDEHANDFENHRRLMSEYETWAGDKVGALRGYASGTYGAEDAKAVFDEANDISDLIDRAPKRYRPNNERLFRGLVLTDSELAQLKEGGSANIKGLTSWSSREMVAHMYAQGDDYGVTMGDKQGHPVVFIEEGVKDGMIMPYTYPQYEFMRSKRKDYIITKIVPESAFKKPLYREHEITNDSYTKPVTYVYVRVKERK